MKPALDLYRHGFRIHRDAQQPDRLIRDALTDEGRAAVSAHYNGWRLTHDLLGACAPAACVLVNDNRIEREFVQGDPLNVHYGRRLRGDRLPPPNWSAFFEALPRVWESGRSAPRNPTFTAVTLWASWYAIAEIRSAKGMVLRGALRRPGWSIEAARQLVAGKLRGGYARTPALAAEILGRSREGLLLGDVHFDNLIAATDRLAFVDFSEVGTGPIALDLAPLWFDWWLARGAFEGDDGFLDGFTELWREYVGPEAMLTALTRAWAARSFRWLHYGFDRFHLRAPDAAAMRRAAVSRRLAAIRGDRLLDFVAEVP